MQRAHLAGKDIHRFCTSLGVNKHLKVLRIGGNQLGDEGIDHLSEAIAINTCLEHLDLFDVPFTNNGARFLEQALRRNSVTLKSLRLANTRVTVDHAEALIDAVNNSVGLLSFRWVNLLPMREGRGWDRSDKDKVI